MSEKESRNFDNATLNVNKECFLMYTGVVKPSHCRSSASISYDWNFPPATIIP